jgi:dienelactone hydrolase
MGATAITGAADVGNRINQKSRECPNMQFAVIGYSVGGAIAANGLKQVSGAAKSRVKAVVLYAPFGGAKPPNDFKSRTLKNCAKGDSVSIAPSHTPAADCPGLPERLKLGRPHLIQYQGDQMAHRVCEVHSSSVQRQTAPRQSRDRLDPVLAQECGGDLELKPLLLSSLLI